MKTIRIPNCVHLPLSAQGLYDTVARILLASQGQPGNLKKKIRAGCEGDLEPAWKELTIGGYLKHIVIPIGENHFEHYYELLYKPDLSRPYIQHLTAAEGRKYLANPKRIRGYKEPDKHYTHIPVAMLSDKRATLAMRGVLDYAWRTAALEKNGLLTLNKKEIVKETRCKKGRVDAPWKLAKELGYLYQQRVLDEKTGRISWIYNLLEMPDAEYCAAARPAVVRAGDVQRKGNTIKRPATTPRVARGKEEREAVAALIRDNLEYDVLIDGARKAPLYYHVTDIDGYVKLIADTVCTNKETVRIGGEDLPADTVREQLLKLTADHLLYVMECIDQQDNIHNPRAYKLTALYRAADSMDISYKVG